MTLRNILQQSDYINLSDSNAFAALLQTQTFPGDSTPYTWSGIGRKLVENGVTPIDLATFFGGISALPGGPILDKCLNSGGFDFADAFNRAIIQSFEINEPEWAVSVLEAMLAIGAPQVIPTWQVLKLSQEPILEDITTTRATIATQADKDAFAALYNSVVEQFESGEITTLSQAKSAMGV
jgi:hypothetical protein